MPPTTAMCWPFSGDDLPKVSKMERDFVEQLHLQGIEVEMPNGVIAIPKHYPDHYKDRLTLVVYPTIKTAKDREIAEEIYERLTAPPRRSEEFDPFLDSDPLP